MDPTHGYTHTRSVTCHRHRFLRGSDTNLEAHGLETKVHRSSLLHRHSLASLLPVFLPCVNNGILGHLVYFVGYLLYVIVGGGTVCRQQGFHYPRHVDDDLKMTAAGISPFSDS